MAVAAPEAVSYAHIAGLDPATALYTGLLGPLAYALAGASPQLIVGPTAIMCILTFNAIPLKWAGVALPSDTDPTCPTKAPCGPAAAAAATRTELAALLALAVAGFQLLIGVLRLGNLVSLISMPVVVGFTTGSALLTASSQFAALVGFAAKCGGNAGCTFGQAVVDVFQRWGQIQWPVVGMSIFCVALLLAVKAAPAALRLPPRFALLASLSPLVLVLVTVPLAYAYENKLAAWGLPKHKDIVSGLPALRLPFGGALAGATSDDVAGLLRAALPLAVIGYMGAVTIAKTVARQNGPYAVHSEQEVWGQVAANAACAVGGGLPVTGSFSRTAVNCSSGARTGLASLMTGALMGLALLALTGPLSYIPTVARSAIVLVAIAKMVELHLLPAFWAADKRDALVFLATLGVVLFVDPSTGLAAGVVLQWLLALQRGGGGDAPAPTRVLAWERGGGGGGGGGGVTAGAAGERLKGAGWAWGDVTARVAGGAPPPPVCAARLSLAPDAQFPNAERAERLIGEAAALLRPAAVVLDLEGCGGEGGGGVALDCTGALALLALPAAAGRAPVALYGLGAPSLRRLAHCARALFKGAQVSGEGASAAAVAAAVACARLDGAMVGELHLLPSWASAQQWAAEVCAAVEAEGVRLAVVRVGKGSLQSGGEGEGYEPLLGEEPPAEEEGGAGADEGADRVAGVAESPLSVRARAARHALGVPAAQTGAQALVELRGAMAEKASGPLLALAKRELRVVFDAAAKALAESQPLLVATV
jgi:MFS superfamily sulfate permease-like transporter